MKINTILEKRSYRILIALVIGIIFVCGAFLMQRTETPIPLKHVNPDNIKYESRSNVMMLYNGINQTKINGYSGIHGVKSTNTEITVIAVPSGGDPYSGYQLPDYQFSYPDITLVLGGDQEYSQAGVVATCNASQIPTGMYFIAFLTENADGNYAYTITDYTFQNGLYEDTLNMLFLLIGFAVYSLFAFVCLELLHKGKNAPPGAPLPTGGEVPKKHSFLSILNLIFLVLSCWIFLNITFANISEFANLETYKALYSVWAALLVFIVMYSAWYGMDFAKKPSAKVKLLAVAGCAAFFLFQLGVCNSNSGLIPYFDSSEVAKSAFSYLQNGSAVTYNPTYFVVYPNNYFLLFTDIGLLKLVGNSIAEFNKLSYLVNIILLDISLLLTYQCIKELFGRRTAIVMLLPLCLVIGLNPIMIMFYTDTLSMVFPVLVFFLYLKLRKTKKIPLKILLLIAIALSAYVGYQYKMTTIILPVAIALVELALHIKDWKKLVSAALACVLVFGIVFALNTKTDELTYKPPFLALDYKGNPDLEPFPFWHWVMIGLHYPDGTFNIEDWNFSITRPKDTRDAETRHMVKVRLLEYGPAEYIAFLNSKLSTAFGQSTFSIGTKEYYYSMPESTISKLSQDVFGSTGKWFPVFAYTLQGAWILCLFLIACPLFFKNKKRVDRNVTILRIALGGMIAYLLVSENNPRQLVNQIPLILILASYSLPPVMDGFKKLASRACAKLKNAE